jgi:hypothetical protein
MKKIILSLVLVGMIGFMGCEKEPIPTPNPTVNLLVDEEPNAVVDSMGTVIFDNPMTSDVTSTTDALILDYPAFLDYDPFTLITVRSGSIDDCVKGLEITKDQRAKLETAWVNKLNCEKTNKELLSKVNRELEAWAKREKLAMYNKYMKTKDSLYADCKMKIAYVNEKYTKGLITLETKVKMLNEIETKRDNDLAALEKSYKSGLESLNNKLKEKIKTNTDRKDKCDKIKDCEKIWLNSVMEILGKEKYKKWIECYKYHYKKK